MQQSRYITFRFLSGREEQTSKLYACYVCLGNERSCLSTNHVDFRRECKTVDAYVCAFVVLRSFRVLPKVNAARATPFLLLGPILVLVPTTLSVPMTDCRPMPPSVRCDPNNVAAVPLPHFLAQKHSEGFHPHSPSWPPPGGYCNCESELEQKRGIRSSTVRSN